MRSETEMDGKKASVEEADVEGRAATDRRLTVLQCKFSSYLSWSQPFIHKLLAALAEEVHNVVVCYRTQHLDRFAVEDLVRLRARYLTEPRLAPQAASYLRSGTGPT